MTDSAYRRGDVVVCALPGDFGKLRPAVVVQADLFNPTHKSVVVCPVTSDLTGLSLFRIPIAASVATGFRKPSEVMVDKVSAILTTRVTKRIGRLSRTQISHLDRALRLWLELPEN